MKKLFTLILFVGAIFISSNSYGQYLSDAYQTTLNEIVENFETIRGSNSLNEGKNSLRLLSNGKIILRIEHKKKVKTLTFEQKLDEEGDKYWMSSNTLTTDMINKYEKDLTKILNKMLALSRKLSKI